MVANFLQCQRVWRTDRLRFLQQFDFFCLDFFNFVPIRMNYQHKPIWKECCWNSTMILANQSRETNVIVFVNDSSRWSEISVAIVFLLMIILWVTKDFSGTPGWEVIFEEKYISDGTVAILCGILPLILPNANPFESKLIWYDPVCEGRRLSEDWKYVPIIQWNSLAKSMPWGALILLGAGLVVATAFQVSLWCWLILSWKFLSVIDFEIINQRCSCLALSSWCTTSWSHSPNYHHQWLVYRSNIESKHCKHLLSSFGLCGKWILQRLSHALVSHRHVLLACIQHFSFFLVH